MFKKILSFVVLAILYCCIFSKSVNASEITDYFTKTFIGNYHYVDSNGNFGDFEHIKRTSDGQTTYCIEPGVPLSENVYQGYYGLTTEEKAIKVGLTKEQLYNVSLIAYFGWKYNGHDSIEWLVATQSLIWKETGRNFQFTSRNSAANPFQFVIDTPMEIQTKMDEIERLVFSYKKEPFFSNAKVQIPINDSYSFIDNENSLIGYQINSCVNCSALINDNKLIVTPNSNQDGEVTLIKKNNVGNTDFVVYQSNVGQNLIVSGNVDPIQFNVSFKVIAGQIELQKKNSKTNSCQSSSSFAKLSGAIYGIYEDKGTLINKLIVNEDCKVLSERNLPLGNYYLQEIKAPLGYKLNDKKYYFSITQENINQVISLDVFDDIYETKLVINKSYLNFNDIYPENEAKFIIYDKNTNQKVAELVTNDLGEGSAILPYGEYIIKQLEGKEGYHFVKDIDLIVDENVNNITYISLINKPYKGNLAITKVDSITHESLPGAYIKIYNENDDLIYEGTTDENGKIVVNNLTYGRYYILETKAPLGYSLSTEKIYFDILEDGELVTVEMKNNKLLNVPNTLLNDLDIQYLIIVLSLLVGIILLRYGKSKN